MVLLHHNLFIHFYGSSLNNIHLSCKHGRVATHTSLSSRNKLFLCLSMAQGIHVEEIMYFCVMALII